MKTIKKMKYLAPNMEVLEIEMEEGIAAVSPGNGVANPGTSPGSNGWEEGTPGGGNWEAN